MLKTASNFVFIEKKPGISPAFFLPNISEKLCYNPRRNEFGWVGYMAARTLALDDATYDYLLRWGVRESEAQHSLREATHHLRHAKMQSSPEQGQFFLFSS